MITIHTPQNGGSLGTMVTDEHGAEIDNIASINIAILPNEFIVATLEVLVTESTIHAHPLLGVGTVRSAARAHGFDLVQIAGETVEIDTSTVDQMRHELLDRVLYDVRLEG